MGDLSTLSEVLETGSGSAAADTVELGSLGASGAELGNAAGISESVSVLGCESSLGTGGSSWGG